MSISTLLSLGVRSIPGLNVFADLRVRNKLNIEFHTLVGSHDAKRSNSGKWVTSDPYNQKAFDVESKSLARSYQHNKRVFTYGMALTAVASITAAAMGALGIGVALAATVIASALYSRYADKISILTVNHAIRNNYPLSGLLY